MKIVVLTDKFYADYSGCPEILQKRDRPYVCAIIETGGKVYGVPLRHHIQHNYAFRTVGEAGLDYTKTVIITDKTYIAPDNPIIDSREFKAIQTNESTIQRGLKKYIKLYRNARRYPANPHYANILKYSTLQYFEKDLP